MHRLDQTAYANRCLAYSVVVAISLWKTIAEKYAADILSGRLGPGDRLPSDAALSELSGVSRVTAHKALAELSRMGLVRRDGRRGTVVLPLAELTTGKVALVLDQVALHRDFPRSDLLAGIHEGLGDSHSLLWCDSKLDASREAEFLQHMPKETDGIICWPTGRPESNSTLNALTAARSPLVLVDRVPKGVSAHAVISDSRGAGLEALEYLASRGHERIGLLAFDKPHVSAAEERVLAYDEFVTSRGLSSEGLTRLFPAALEFDSSDWFYQAVQDSLFAMVSGTLPATALFCAQDMFCAAAISAAVKLGLRLPDDLEIASYTDWPLRMLGQPWQVHRIHTQADVIGRKAASLLLEQISGSWTEPEIHRIPSLFTAADAGIGLPRPNRLIH